MSDFQRFVPNGCEFYQYREAMEDVPAFVRGDSPARSTPVLVMSMTVRRKSDGYFFGMSWTSESTPESVQHEADQLADAVVFERLGGRRIDLGEANLGQAVRVAGDPRGTFDAICCIDDAAKTYKLRTSNKIIPWSDAREP